MASPLLAFGGIAISALLKSVAGAGYYGELAKVLTPGMVAMLDTYLGRLASDRFNLVAAQSNKRTRNHDIEAIIVVAIKVVAMDLRDNPESVDPPLSKAARSQLPKIASAASKLTESPLLDSKTGDGFLSAHETIEIFRSGASAIDRAYSTQTQWENLVRELMKSVGLLADGSEPKGGLLSMFRKKHDDEALIAPLATHLQQNFAKCFMYLLRSNSTAYNAMQLYLQSDVLGSLKEISNELQEVSRILIGAPVLSLFEDGHSRLSSLSFAARSNGYLERPEAHVAMRDLLGDSNEKVRWLLLHGRAGLGKSRTALEFCIDLCRESSGWLVGFLMPSSSVDWSHWKPGQPTLMVIDTAREVNFAIGQAQNLTALQWVKEMDDRAQREEWPHPLRVVFLERLPLRRGSVDPTFRRKVDSMGNSVRLAALTPAQVGSMISERKGPPELSAWLAEHEVHAPLDVLLALAWCLQHPSEPLPADYRTLLADTMEAERERWSQSGVTWREIELLFAASISDGMSLGEMVELISKDYAECSDQHLAVLQGHTQDPGARLSRMVPDMLAERFVLDRFVEEIDCLAGDRANKEARRTAAEAILSELLVSRRESAGKFLVRLQNSFGEEAGLLRQIPGVMEAIKENEHLLAELVFVAVAKGQKTEEEELSSLSINSPLLLGARFDAWELAVEELNGPREVFSANPTQENRRVLAHAILRAIKDITFRLPPALYYLMSGNPPPYSDEQFLRLIGLYEEFRELMLENIKSKEDARLVVDAVGFSASIVDVGNLINFVLAGIRLLASLDEQYPNDAVIQRNASYFVVNLSSFAHFLPKEVGDEVDAFIESLWRRSQPEVRQEITRDYASYLDAKDEMAKEETPASYRLMEEMLLQYPEDAFLNEVYIGFAGRHMEANLDMAKISALCVKVEAIILRFDSPYSMVKSYADGLSNVAWKARSEQFKIIEFCLAKLRTLVEIPTRKGDVLTMYVMSVPAHLAFALISAINDVRPKANEMQDPYLEELRQLYQRFPDDGQVFRNLVKGLRDNLMLTAPSGCRMEILLELVGLKSHPLMNEEDHKMLLGACSFMAEGSLMSPNDVTFSLEDVLSVTRAQLTVVDHADVLSTVITSLLEVQLDTSLRKAITELTRELERIYAMHREDAAICEKVAKGIGYSLIPDFQLSRFEIVVAIDRDHQTEKSAALAAIAWGNRLHIYQSMGGGAAWIPSLQDCLERGWPLVPTRLKADGYAKGWLTPELRERFLAEKET